MAINLKGKDAVKEPPQHLGSVLHALLLAHLAASGVQIGDLLMFYIEEDSLWRSI